MDHNQGEADGDETKALQLLPQKLKEEQLKTLRAIASMIVAEKSGEVPPAFFDQRTNLAQAFCEVLDSRCGPVLHAKDSPGLAVEIGTAGNGVALRHWARHWPNLTFYPTDIRAHKTAVQLEDFTNSKSAQVLPQGSGDGGGGSPGSEYSESDDTAMQLPARYLRLDVLERPMVHPKEDAGISRLRGRVKLLIAFDFASYFARSRQLYAVGAWPLPTSLARDTLQSAAELLAPNGVFAWQEPAFVEDPEYRSVPAVLAPLAHLAGLTCEVVVHDFNDRVEDGTMFLFRVDVNQRRCSCCSACAPRPGLCQASGEEKSEKAVLKMLVCPCKHAFYCKKECQKADWKLHKHAHNDILKPKGTTAFNFRHKSVREYAKTARLPKPFSREDAQEVIQQAQSANISPEQALGQFRHWPSILPRVMYAGNGGIDPGTSIFGGDEDDSDRDERKLHAAKVASQREDACRKLAAGTETPGDIDSIAAYYLVRGHCRIAERLLIDGIGKYPDSVILHSAVAECIGHWQGRYMEAQWHLDKAGELDKKTRDDKLGKIVEVIDQRSIRDGDEGPPIVNFSLGNQVKVSLPLDLELPGLSANGLRAVIELQPPMLHEDLEDGDRNGLMKRAQQALTAARQLPAPKKYAPHAAIGPAPSMVGSNRVDMFKRQMAINEHIGATM